MSKSAALNWLVEHAPSARSAQPQRRELGLIEANVLNALNLHGPMTAPSLATLLGVRNGVARLAVFRLITKRHVRRQGFDPYAPARRVVASTSQVLL